MNYKITGKATLSGSVSTNVSKNAAVALLAASLLNRGRTTLKRMPRIEEVQRLIEVLCSIGVTVTWEGDDLVVVPAQQITLDDIDEQAAEKTRSIALFLGPLIHLLPQFRLPQPGGCRLGVRTLAPHIKAFAALGVDVCVGDDGALHVDARKKHPADIVMYEASDTGTENALMAAARIPGVTTIRFATSNYMVQDLCVFLRQCGVRIEGIGTTTLMVHGISEINCDVECYPSEDPIESMFFFSLAATTASTLHVQRCPIEFLELELLTLEAMGLQYERGTEYLSENGHTKLVDVTLMPSLLHAPEEQIAPRPYPGLNIDNLPFFVPIATQAAGRTLIHDWVYENRAVYYMEMKKLGADMILADPHRVFIEGPRPLRAADIKAPSALRPATILLIGMLASEGTSLLFDVYPINRGYERLHERLACLGAQIEVMQ